MDSWLVEQLKLCIFFGLSIAILHALWYFLDKTKVSYS